MPDIIIGVHQKELYNLLQQCILHTKYCIMENSGGGKLANLAKQISLVFITQPNFRFI